MFVEWNKMIFSWEMIGFFKKTRRKNKTGVRVVVVGVAIITEKIIMKT